MASVFKRGGKGNRGGAYQISWVDHTGKRSTKSSRTTDKAAAERIVRKLEAGAALRREGVIDPTLDTISTESQRPIESHLADYESKLRAANRTDDYVDRTVGFIRWISEWAGFGVAADISVEGVNRYACHLKDKGRAARTIQAHLTAIKGLTRWLTEHHKLPRDPLASVRKPNPKADRRRERRMLLLDEWPWLVAATLRGPDRLGMDGTERMLLYRTAVETGLRSSELRSLTRGNLYLREDSPFITCKAGSTKNRQNAKQYVQPELATDLQAHIATKAPKTAVFSMPHRTRLAAMLRADLAEARKAWLAEATHDPDEYAKREQSDFLAATNHDGEVVDFHALRHTTGAWMTIAGVHPKAVQTVMRHSTVELTLGAYGHLAPGQEIDAVVQLGRVLAVSLDALKATGTDDEAAEASKGRAAHAQRAGRDGRRIGASHCDGDTRAADGEDVHDDERNLLQIAALDDEVRRGAKGSSSGRGGIRTHTPLTGYGILSPVRLPVPPLGRQRAALRWAGGVRKAAGCLVPRS